MKCIMFNQSLALSKLVVYSPSPPFLCEVMGSLRSNSFHHGNPKMETNGISLNISHCCIFLAPEEVTAKNCPCPLQAVPRDI